MGSSLGAHRPAAPSAQLLAIALSMLAFVPAVAQEPVRSFDQLDTRLKAGDTVWVADASGHEVRGRILQLTPSSLVLAAERQRTFGVSEVRAVREPVGRSLGKAALWGTVAGAGTGLVLALAVRREYASYCSPEQAAAGCFPPPGREPPIDWWSVPVCAGLGAGLGVIVGALLPARARDVYLAPRDSARTAPRAQWSVAPVLSPRQKAVAILLSF